MKVLTKEEVLSIRLDNVDGYSKFVLDGRELDGSIKQTEVGRLMYTMEYGYILIPNGATKPNEFIKLADYLKQHGIEIRTEKLLKTIAEKEIKFKEEREQLKKQHDEMEKHHIEDVLDVPDGYFCCWECGSISPVSKRLHDGTCGC